MEFTVNYNLTEKDFERIAEKVIQKQSDESFMKKITDISEKAAEKRYWHLFTKQHSEVEINDLLKKHLLSLVKLAMTEQNLLQIELNKVLNKDEIKRLGAKRLRDIAYQLEKEAEEQYENES